MTGVKAGCDVIEHHETWNATILGRSRQEDRGRHGIPVTLREKGPSAEILQAEEISQLQIDVLAVQRAAQGRLHVRPAADEAAEEVLTGGLNLLHPPLGQPPPSVPEARGRTRHERPPPPHHPSPFPFPPLPPPPPPPL